MRDPLRNPKCYEMTNEEKQQSIMRQNRNVWNEPEQHLEEEFLYYGA